MAVESFHFFYPDQKVRASGGRLFQSTKFHPTKEKGGKVLFERATL